MQEVIYCRTAPSIGELEGNCNDVWGTKEYPIYDPPLEAPAVFFGLYGFRDFTTLWKHQGKKYILWAGSDIRHFQNDYWLDELGTIRIPSESLAKWINAHCESWVENEVEAEALERMGITSQVCPSFLGDVKDYEIEFEPSPNPKLYASVSGNDFALYQWSKIELIAAKNPKLEFHLYGNTVPWHSTNPNVIVHGRVPKEQMNREIKKMHGAIRPLPFDGFSEVLAKSILWGQYPVSEITYKHMYKMDNLDLIQYMKEPNIAGRNHYLKTLNAYPWNTNK